MDLHENTGRIYKNENRTNSKHPEYRGMLNIDGKKVNIALWIKRAKTENQRTYFDCSISNVLSQEVAEEIAIIESEEAPKDPLKTILPN